MRRQKPVRSKPLQFSSSSRDEWDAICSNLLARYDRSLVLAQYPALISTEKSWANTVTAYLLQQIKLLAHRDRHSLSPWSPASNRSVKLSSELSVNRYAVTGLLTVPKLPCCRRESITMLSSIDHRPLNRRLLVSLILCDRMATSDSAKLRTDALYLIATTPGRHACAINMLSFSAVSRISFRSPLSSSSVATPVRATTGTVSANVCSHNRFSGPRK
jgi:hypothetical protein